MSEIRNPLVKYKWTLLGLLLAFVITIFVFGYAAPVLISAPHTELVIAGIVLIAGTIILDISLVVKAMNFYDNERNY